MFADIQSLTQPKPHGEFNVQWIRDKETRNTSDSQWWTIRANWFATGRKGIVRRNRAKQMRKYFLIKICIGHIASEWALDSDLIMCSLSCQWEYLWNQSKFWFVSVGFWPKLPFLLIVTWKLCINFKSSWACFSSLHMADDPNSYNFWIIKCRYSKTYWRP